MKKTKELSGNGKEITHYLNNGRTKLSKIQNPKPIEIYGFIGVFKIS